MTISILGIDIGKNSCSVVGVDDKGAVIVRRTMRRQTLIEFVDKMPACIIAMEACCGAHHLGRLFAAQGHEVRLMSPEYVRPYIKAQKNDDRDPEGSLGAPPMISRSHPQSTTCFIRKVSNSDCWH